MVTASWIANPYETLGVGVGTSQNYRSFMTANVSNVFILCSFCQGHLSCIEDGNIWLNRMLKSSFQGPKMVMDDLVSGFSPREVLTNLKWTQLRFSDFPNMSSFGHYAVTIRVRFFSAWLK